MISSIKGGMQAEGVWKQDPGANIWVQEGWEYGVEKVDNEKLRIFFRLSNVVKVMKSRLENSIGMGVTEIGVNTRNWVDLAQDRDYWMALVIATLSLRIS